jgi:hypothetical protein
MGTRTRRGIRLGLMTAGFAGLFVAVSAVPGVATLGSGFAPTLLGHGSLADGSLRVNPEGEIVVTKNDVAPGGYSGWHSHPGGAIVVVQSGQITTYRVVGNDDAEEGASFSCVSTTYMAGDAFVERPGEPLNAVNNGSTPTVIYATFPGVPALGQQRTDQPKPNPDPCPV